MEVEADAPSRLASLGAALATDRPWSTDNDRRSLFLSCLLIGLLAGALEGAAISDPNLDIARVQGDASFWDTVASGAWMGAAAGAACGLALTATRNIWARVPLAGFLGVLLVPAALILSSGGLPLGHWEGDGVFDGVPLLGKPLGWGVYLGSAMAGTLATVTHLTRRCMERPRILLLVMLLGIALGARSQAFFWDDWVSLKVPNTTCIGRSYFIPSGPGGVILAMTTVAVVLALHRFQRRGCPRRFVTVLGSTVAALSLFLVWAVRFMPFTGASDVVDMTFHPDGDQLITMHAGNTIRVWDLPEDVRGRALPPKEIGSWRFTKRRGWHAPMALRYPYAAAVVPRGIQIWQLPRMREIAFIPLSEGWSQLAFSPDASRLAVTRRFEARVFRLEWDEPSRRLRIPEEFGLGGAPLNVANYTNGRTLAVSNDGRVSLVHHRYSTQEGPLELRKEFLHSAVHVVSLSDGTEILAANGIDCSYLWNSGRVGGLMTFRPPMPTIHWALLSSDERLLALLGKSERWIVDVERGRLILHDRKIQDIPELVMSSPEGDWTAAIIRGRIETWKWPAAEIAR